jgi:hypothetical protein
MTKEEKEKEQLLLEQRKVKALEKIANSVDALTIWFEEIDKEEWDKRIQFYLHEWYKNILKDRGFNTPEDENQETKPKKGK